MQIKTVFNSMTPLLSSLFIGMLVYAPIITLGNVEAAEGVTQQPSPLDLQRQNQVDLLFLQKNLSANDAEKLRQQMNMYGDTDVGAQRIINSFKKKLAAQGDTVPQKPIVPATTNTSSSIDLAKYKPIDLPKEPDWIESEIGDMNGKGFYVETSDKGRIIKVQVGLWEKYNGTKEVVSRSCRNAHGVEIGPQVEYFTSETGTPGQIKSVSVNFGFLPTDMVEGVALTDLTQAKVRELKKQPTFDSFTFHKNGALAKSFTYGTDGSTHQQVFNPGGVILMEEIRKPDGMRTRRSFSPTGVLLDETIHNMNDQKDLAFIRKSFMQNSDLQTVQIKALRTTYAIPVRSADTPPGAKLIVNWTNAGDELKGIQSAGFITGPNVEDRNGSWVEFNAQGTPVRQGTYKAGKQEGVWTEMEYEVMDGSGGLRYAELIATMKGRYTAGAKVGIWQTEYGQSHPVVRELKAKADAIPGRRATATINDFKGYLETNTYSDGKIVKTDRNF